MDATFTLRSSLPRVGTCLCWTVRRSRWRCSGHARGVAGSDRLPTERGRMADLSQLSANERLLVFAPHPDDDVLACGGLLQRAAAALAAVGVVFVTDGENNPW